MARFLRYGVFILAALSCSAIAAIRTPISEPPGRGSISPGSGSTAVTVSRGFPAVVSGAGGARLPVTLTTTRGYGWPTIRSGMKTLVTRNPLAALTAGGLGVAIAGAEWVMNEGALTKTNPLFGQDTCAHAYYGGPGAISTACEFTSGADACRSLYQMSGVNISRGAGALVGPGGVGGNCYYYPANGGTIIQSGQWERITPQDPQFPPYIPVTTSDLDGLVGGITDPLDAASSAPFIFDNVPGSFDSADTYDLSGPSSLPGNPTTTTTTNQTTGDVIVVDSSPTHTFDYQWDPTSNIAPSVTTTTSTTTNTYTNGQPTETTTTTDAGPDPVTDPVIVGGGGGGANVTIEIPTDCDFMPTVCSFIEWVKAPFEPEPVDLSDLAQDQDFRKSVTISGSAICPAPLILNTDLGNFEFSWEPACNWAEMLKPLLLIAALLSAIYITLGIGRGD